MKNVIPTLGILIPLASAAASPIVVDRAQPSLDRWNYPFNFTPGYRTAISTFSALGQEELAGLTFDQRDAQMVIAFETHGDVPTGLGPGGYCIGTAEVRINVSTSLVFEYDPSQDDWQTYLEAGEPGALPDTDAGRPLEMFGAGFRAPWDAATYFEGTAPAPGPDFGPMIASDVRYVYPTDAIAGATDDVSNNVRDAFDPKPFAIGTTGAVAPGALVPANTEFTFALDVTDPDVQAYLQNAVDTGTLYLVIAALQPAASADGGGPGTGNFATFYSKENIFGNGRAARLHLDVTLTMPGDTNGDSVINFDDLNAVLGAWATQVAPGTNGDTNCDGFVDFNDLNAVLDNWDG